MTALKRTVTVLSAATGALAIAGGAAAYVAAHFLGVPVTALLTDRAAALSGKSVPMPGLALPPLSPAYWATATRESTRTVAAHIRGMSKREHKNQVGQNGVINDNDGEFAKRTYTDPKNALNTLRGEIDNATRRYDLTNAKIIGEEVLAAFPNAKTIRVQGYSENWGHIDYWHDASLLDADDNLVGYMYDDTIYDKADTALHTFSFRIDSLVYRIPTQKPRQHIANDRHGRSELDPGYDWLTFEDSQYGLIDVPAAAAITV